MSATNTPGIKAWTYNHTGYPSCLRLSTVPGTASAPSPTHILVRVRAAALNPVDIQLMNFALWGCPVPLPLAPYRAVAAGTMGVGEDFAGEVLAAGSATGLAPGDEVFGLGMPVGGSSGALQEVASIGTAATAVVKKPKTWSWEMAAALPLVWLTARTAVEAVSVAVEQARRGRKLVVLGGSSSVGMYVVHLARQRGWKVAASCSSRNVEFVQGMGADEVIDYTQCSVPEAVKKLGPDAIIDCVGGTECLRLAGRYVTIVGDKTSRASMGGNLTYFWNPQMVLRRWLGQLGLGVWYDCVNLEFKKEWLEEALTLPERKIIVDSTFDFDKAKEAFDRLNTGRTRGKVVVRVAQ